MIAMLSFDITNTNLFQDSLRLNLRALGQLRGKLTGHFTVTHPTCVNLYSDVTEQRMASRNYVLNKLGPILQFHENTPKTLSYQANNIDRQTNGDENIIPSKVDEVYNARFYADVRS